jgi:hypothetical protein
MNFSWKKRAQIPSHEFSKHAELRNWQELVRSWEGFDPNFYQDTYRSFRIRRDPEQHFYNHGLFENRLPNAVVLMDQFSKSRRLDMRPFAPILVHMIIENAVELSGHLPYIDPFAQPIESLLLEWGEFDPDYYRAAYPDVRKAKCNPLQHFCVSGLYEFRNPNKRLNVREFAIENPSHDYAYVPPLFWMIK